MRIINYDCERAKTKLEHNNKRVLKYNKFARTAFFIKSGLVILMALCILAMCGCLVAMFIIDKNILNNIIIYPMIGCVGLSTILLLVFFQRRKVELCHDDYFDNSETKYYRATKQYKLVSLDINSKNEIGMICLDDNDEVTACSIKPKFVKISNKIKTPTLDFKYDCLWLPA